MCHDYIPTGTISEDVFDLNRNGDWRLLVFQKEGRQFMVSLSFLGVHEVFVLYILLPADEEFASNFKVTISLEETDAENPTKMIHVLDVVSIEEMKNLPIIEIPPSKCLVLNRRDVLRYVTCTANRDDRYSTIHFPICIEEILEEN